MAKFCGNCGNKMDSDATFCTNCGTSNSGVVKSTSSSDGSYVNGFAIAGFICSFLFAFVGLILSIVGLSKANENDGSGKGLAIAGIVIAAVNMFLGFILAIARVL